MSRHLKADEIVFKHDFFRTRKFAGLTFAEIGMLVCGVAHSHREENDGFLAGHLLGELGGVDGLGLDDGALTGLYVPASHDALARRLVRSGLPRGPRRFPDPRLRRLPGDDAQPPDASRPQRAEAAEATLAGMSHARHA